MFISKINVSQPHFKGIYHVKNNVGQKLLKFNYAFDSENEICEIQIFKITPTYKYNYKIDESPIGTFKLNEDGINIDPQDLGLGENEAFAYKVIRKDKNTGNIIYEGPDTGVNMRPHQNNEYGFRAGQDKKWEEREINGKKFWYETPDFQDATSNYKYTFVNRNGTTPLIQGAAYLLSPDSFKPGARYDSKTGEIIYDKKYQQDVENEVKNFSNVWGGSLAGIQANLPYIKENGYRTIITTPYANGAKAWSLGYWNKNNFQLGEGMGNTENFASFFEDLFKYGIKNVNDGTFTSEGWEGIHLQYALRWAGYNPQTERWFKRVTNDEPLSIGVIPKNAQNLRHRIINAKYNYIMQSDGTYKAEPNPNYNPNKETIGQIYDIEQSSERQIQDYDNVIKNYERIREGNLLDFNSHDDTLINVTFTVDNKIYDRNVKKINDLIKNEGKTLSLDSVEGTIIATEMPEYKLSRKKDGGIVTWDSNTDMFKLNYQVSGYDQKRNKSITNDGLRDYEQKLQIRSACEVQDIALQSAVYWTEKVQDVQKFYIAQTVKNSNSKSDIEKLIKEGKLPASSALNDETLKNIINGHYLWLNPKGVLEKDDITVKSLMKLPLDSLELSDNTVGVLSTSYFSNRATTPETVGKSRFELMKNGNPHLVEPYKNIYHKVETLYKSELKNFADDIIKELNKNSTEKLIKDNGEYTEYGEYIIELIGADITKYALLKALGGEHFEAYTLKDNKISYNYDKLKNNTSLKQLGINAHNPTEEAEILEKKIENGIKTLNESDIKFIANSVSKRISGTNTNSFRIAEVISDNSGLGLDWRLDAIKDIADMDAVRNEDNDMDDNFNTMMLFCKKFVQAVKSKNRNSTIIAEMTDIPDLFRFTYGDKSKPYDGDTNINDVKFNGATDALIKFYNETGITTEAAYDYFFTDLLTSFAPAFDTGEGECLTHDAYKNKIDQLLQTRSADYLRNLYNFAGNQDKPRILDFALDMNLFHNKGDKTKNNLDCMMVLSGSKDYNSIPIELKLNANNPEYHRTMSTRAVAMSKLLMSVLNENTQNIISNEDRNLINNALVDLANGNYLGSTQNVNYQRIQLKELSSIEGALDEIIPLSQKYGLNLSNSELEKLKINIINNANNDFKNYIINGNFDWIDENEAIGIHNRKLAYSILNKKDGINEVSDEDVKEAKMYNKYSLYTVSLAALIRDSYLKTGPKSKDAMLSALKDFVEKYDENKVNSSLRELPKIQDPIIAMKQNGYAARDIKTAITMAVKQAEYNSKKNIENKEKLINTMHKYATEPAVGKGTIMMKFLGGLFGMPTMYAGDELGMTGYEEKTKNIYLQNRNVLPWSDIENNTDSGKYRQQIMKSMNGALSNRSNPEIEVINNGTPYSIDVEIMKKNREQTMLRIAEIKTLLEDNPPNKDDLLKEKEKLEKNLAVISYMMYGANGEAAITLFDASGIRHGNRVNYFELNNIHSEKDRQKFFKDNEIESIDEKNPYVPILPKSEVDAIVMANAISLPIGAIFMNTDKRDTSKYIVKNIDGKRVIVKEDGGKIVIKNGMTILKRVFKNIPFKGGNAQFYNKKYNLASNSYEKKQEIKQGEKLSIYTR